MCLCCSKIREKHSANSSLFCQKYADYTSKPIAGDERHSLFSKLRGALTRASLHLHPICSSILKPSILTSMSLGLNRTTRTMHVPGGALVPPCNLYHFLHCFEDLST